MAHARRTYTVPKSTAFTRTRESRRLLFKTDHPRAIDRYIDYFGGAGGASMADETCGESLLERLA
jgi:hypothetical protein